MDIHIKQYQITLIKEVQVLYIVKFIIIYDIIYITWYVIFHKYSLQLYDNLIWNYDLTFWKWNQNKTKNVLGIWEQISFIEKNE